MAFYVQLFILDTRCGSLVRRVIPGGAFGARWAGPLARALAAARPTPETPPGLVTSKIMVGGKYKNDAN